MLKKIAILVVALSWLLEASLLPGATSRSRRSERSGTAPASLSKSTLRPSASSRSGVKSSKKRSSRSRRRGRRRNVWRVNSYANPTEGDNPAGEDPLARQAAVEALGNLNGAVVVVDPNTGRILSIVNQKLALESAFTPCSTFKPVVGLAALKEGLITQDTQLRVGRRRHMNLTEALAVSNNRFFTRLGQMLGFRRLARYAKQLGLGQKVGWNIPGESPGRFPQAPPKDVGVGILSSYGKDIAVTPLQLAAIISAIANGGTLHYLQYPRTSAEMAQFQPKPRRRLESLVQFFPQIKEGLAAAVLYGTAQSAFDPEEQVFGKTGTCSENGARLGWFVSFAGGEEPKHVVVVLLRGGKRMYGPHAAEIAGRIYRGLRQKPPETAQTPDTSPSINSSL